MSQRITIPEILQDEWFKKGYKPPQFGQEEDVNLDDIDAVFNDSKVSHFNLPVLFLGEVLYYMHGLLQALSNVG